MKSLALFAAAGTASAISLLVCEDMAAVGCGSIDSPCEIKTDSTFAVDDLIDITYTQEKLNDADICTGEVLTQKDVCLKFVSEPVVFKVIAADADEGAWLANGRGIEALCPDALCADVDGNFSGICQLVDSCANGLVGAPLTAAKVCVAAPVGILEALKKPAKSRLRPTRFLRGLKNLKEANFLPSRLK